jgi:ankyrin repeat protein
MAVQAAAQKGVDVNTRVEAGEKRWLEVAAKGGLVETVRALVFLGAEVDHADGLGYTALYTAAAHGETEAVRALAAAGADVNRVDKVGETALCVAAASGHAGVIRALVKAGAGVNHANRDTGETALCR